MRKRLLGEQIDRLKLHHVRRIQLRDCDTSSRRASALFIPPAGPLFIDSVVWDVHVKQLERHTQP